jgi:hypothetical protein
VKFSKQLIYVRLQIFRSPHLSCTTNTNPASPAPTPILLLPSNTSASKPPPPPSPVLLSRTTLFFPTFSIPPHPFSRSDMPLTLPLLFPLPLFPHLISLFFILPPLPPQRIRFLHPAPLGLGVRGWLVGGGAGGLVNSRRLFGRLRSGWCVFAELLLQLEL